MFIAPTEPPALKALGKVSLLPERLGFDVMFMHGGEKHGVQRKEVSDLLSSVADGRLAKELAQMQSTSGRKLLVIEGKPKWTADGRMMRSYGQDWSRRSWNAMQWSVADAGCWVTTTANVAETVDVVKWFREWVVKGKHRALSTRPGPGKGIWGARQDREWVSWTMQSIPGVGPELAERIWDELGNVLTLSVSKEELARVKGLGPKKAEAIWRLFGGH